MVQNCVANLNGRRMPVRSADKPWLKIQLADLLGKKNIIVG